MKQVEYVSVGGYVFSLEDDACLTIKEYLDRLDSFYSKKESGAEVMEGIEERMAELLLERCGRRGVVTLPVAEGVISILGQPEAIENESSSVSSVSEPAEAPEVVRQAHQPVEAPEDTDVVRQAHQPAEEPGAAHTEETDASSRSKRPRSSQTKDKPRRKLYRDPANGKLSGVCSGLATFFDIDPVIFRIAFVVLTLLGGLRLRFLWPLEPWIHISAPIMYLILWICMPAVKTVSQRDELCGQRGTVDDISARVRDTSRQNPTLSDSETWKNVRRILSTVSGVLLLVAGVSGMAFLCSFWWGTEVLGNNFFYNRLIESIASEAPEFLSFVSIPIVALALVLVVALPFLAMLYGGVMLLFGLKSPKWRPGLVLFIVWLMILVALSVSSLMTFATI